MNFLDQMGIDPIYIIAVLALLSVLLFVWIILLQVRYRKLSRKLDIFMRGKDAESLEDIMLSCISDVEKMKSDMKTSKYDISSLRRMYSRSCSKMGVIKYNGFVGMGGKSSFALSLLDSNNSGIILNVIHSREGSYPYIKEVTNGICETSMSEEEKASLEMAMRSK